MSDSNSRFSRRQKLFDMVKTTRDVYIPTISSTFTQLASEATSRALNYNDPDSNIPNKDYHGANIILYPHFTRQGEDGKDFYTQVHGWVYATDGSSRKKRIVLSLARQLCKSNNNVVSDATANQLDEQINSIQEQPESDSASTISGASQTSSVPTSPIRRSGTSSSAGSEFSTAPSSATSDTDEVLKERIAAFVNRSIGNLELTIAIGGGERHELKKVNILTDGNGNFNVDVVTHFKPSYIQITVTEDEKIFEFKDVMMPGKSKFGIISDIDDTIKVTGVCGDKRTIFRNTFANDMSTWEVPGVADFYRFLHQKYDISFFYVSNSPYQLYSSLMKFFQMFEFPIGAVYLKRYTGNILNSFMEPSHSRKKTSLERIFGHFSNRKFFLIGDTSEQDLEAYVDIARAHPEQVVGIYLRVAPNSINVDTLRLILEILSKRNTPENGGELVEKIEHIKQEKNLIDLDDDMDIILKEEASQENLHTLATESELGSKKLVENLIDTGDVTVKGRKAPPKVPKKPTTLRATKPNESTVQARSAGSATSSGANSSNIIKEQPASSTPPALPRRPIPQPPPKSKLSSIASRTLLGAKSFNSEVPFNEETNDEWISRILTSLIILKKAGNIKLKFYNDIDEIHEDIQEHLHAAEKS